MPAYSPRMPSAFTVPRASIPEYCPLLAACSLTFSVSSGWPTNTSDMPPAPPDGNDFTVSAMMVLRLTEKRSRGSNPVISVLNRTTRTNGLID